jgi:hypothetical protein
MVPQYLPFPVPQEAGEQVPGSPVQTPPEQLQFVGHGPQASLPPLPSPITPQYCPPVTLHEVSTPPS